MTLRAISARPYTQASIAFTPVLETVTGGKVSSITWLGCLLAIVGVVVLAGEIT